MPLSRSILMVSLATFIGAPVLGHAGDHADAAASVSISADKVRSMLMRQGYTRIKEIKLDDGQWKVRARDSDGDWQTLHINAQTGQQKADGEVSALTSDQILDKLNAHGYRGYKTLEFDDGEWKTTATNRSGQRVQLKIDASTGKVIDEDQAD
ncbi:PepSY domain-containing protein [Oleiagrimonas sp. C23AA]|uniref:PepSY domain-containing protein n=1 Tax=Oleiagrimonas sp. C23AA TaxID=2719047 RepID=UPI00142336BF|nr:PepSY domain-containing protein [Oleiagrimonas sp. C23AA]NII11932.1 PepSY domain-containing protein [Oleiagrimonas sp. C23AA]